MTITRAAAPRLAVAIAAVAGVLVGTVATLVITDPSTQAAGNMTETPAAPADVNDTPTTTNLQPDAATPATLLVWISGGLPPTLGAAIADLAAVKGSAVVAGDQTELSRSTNAAGDVVDEPATGWVIPLDTLAVDPATFADFVHPAAAPAIDALQPGQAVLTETSLALRRLDIGSTLELDDRALTITGVIDDLPGAGAELIVHADDAERLGVTTPRYLLIHHTQNTRAELTQAVAQLAGPATIRFRSPAETT